MNKNMLLTLVAVLSIAAVTTSALAAGKECATSKECKAGKDNPPGEMQEGRADAVIKDLGITDANKEAQIRQIFQTHRQAMDNWMKENGAKGKDLREQMAKAREAKDEAKIKELQPQLKTLMQSRMQLHKDLMKQLEGALSPEQMDKLRENMGENAMPRIRGILRDKELNLTDEQQAKIKETLKAARDKAEASDDMMEKDKIYRDAHTDIVKNILTDEQRAKLHEMRKEHGGPGSDSKPAWGHREHKGHKTPTTAPTTAPTK
ncbi:MAG: DUF3826 domain-containing protein [Phycisphaerae bacterium]